MIRTSPQPYNPTVYCGRTFTESWLITDDAGDPADLTGVTFRAQARTDYDAASPTITFTCTVSNGVATNDKLTLSVTVATTTALGVTLGHLPASLVFDCEAEEASTQVSPILLGTCDVVPEATR